MSVLSIIRPILGAVSGGGVVLDDASRLMTADPKEVSVVTTAGTNLVVDLGSAQTVGGFMLNAVSRSDLSLYVRTGVAAPGETVVTSAAVLAANKRTMAAPFKYYAQFAPIVARYVEVGANAGNLPAGLEIGNFIVGERFSPSWGHEMGAGRYIIDSGAATRNRAGGFGIDKGAIAAGWDFTLGDLTLDETEQLFDMLKKVGESSPVVVAEDPDATNYLDARLHYGLFQRLEKYERQQAQIVRWSLKVEEWI